MILLKAHIPIGFKHAKNRNNSYGNRCFDIINKIL